MNRRRIIITINDKIEEADIPEKWDLKEIDSYLNRNYFGWVSWKFAKDEAIELVKQIIPRMYCYSGSGFMTDWYDPEIALMNAKECCKIFGTPLISDIQSLTINDIWTEDELNGFNK